ncbi:MAG: hypothetical protein ILA34_00945 [Bacteroidaceae bacterium]|nr:hypothetical protein [Bacteroidaceae bacterium]
MNTMDDNQLDSLLQETLHRMEVQAQIERNVMQTLRRNARRRRLRLWRRCAAFAFGLVAVDMSFVAALLLLQERVGMTPYLKGSLFLAAVTLLVLTVQGLNRFSVGEPS